MIRLNVVNNEWYFTYDVNTNVMITVPEFVDKNKSTIVGDNIGIESYATEKECYSRIKELGLIMPKEEIMK